MRLFAVLLLPQEVTEHLHAMLGGVRVGSDPFDLASRRKRSAGWRDRLFGSRGGDDATDAQHLELVDQAHLHVPLARFGNTALDDAEHLTAALEQQAARWAAPQLHLSGGDVVERSGRTIVRVGVHGDLELLDEIGRGVPRVAQGQHLLVDRREYQPFVEVGTAGAHSTPPYVEAVLTALEGYQGPSWLQASVSLIQLDASHGAFHPYRELALGPADAR